ncbi:hypothetical protein DY000_02004960 [Brassica cretica]|uniref:UBC core domain-containing protein n=1 Tax=Brassica cretica TaxID=69181 RepID=A0ABQ7CEK3_BRACR|nr:hypothetical protein DY000_02004960 [Brassica cretica]
MVLIYVSSGVWISPCNEQWSFVVDKDRMGAWQPSLNISTVLTSLGLLLSEPNPDDGLMCEVSRKYKYNRQALDYKAREMTQKYAVKVKTGDGSSTSLQFQERPNAGEVKSHGDEKVSGNHEKPGIKPKLAVESFFSITHRW